MISLISKRLFRSIPTVLMLTTLFLFFSGPVAAGENSTITIQPFTVHARSELDYLQNGVRAMLASRLAANSGAAIVKNDGKYIVTGSITALGEAISLDARVSSTESAPLSFYATAASQDEIINAINDLSWQISEKIFGKQRPRQQVADTPAARAPVDNHNDQMTKSVQTPHPEKLFINRSAPSQNGSSIPSRGTSVRESTGFTKLPNFKMDLKGMDIGDINGDGLMDIVVVGDDEVAVFKNSNGNYTLMTSHPLAARYPAHNVSVADLNANGLAEIYISGADFDAPRSSGLEWNGESFTTLFDDAAWYIRAMPLPGHGMSLVGQRTETSSAFRPGIYRLERQGNVLIPEEKISVPDYINLFDFSIDDIDGDGSNDIIAISQTDTLYVLRANHSLAWQSDDNFGGTTRYVGGIDESKYSAIDTERENDGIGVENKEERVYIAPRIITIDLNNDGIKDVLVNKNLSTASRLFERMKKYPSGEIYGLSWDGISLAELWRSRKINGYVADYQLAPGADGRPATLFVAVVLNPGWLGSFGKPESTVLMYQLQ